MADPIAADAHLLPPRDRWSLGARKRRDTYEITPGAPLLRGEFGFGSLDAWKRQGMAANADVWGEFGRRIFLFEDAGECKLDGLGWCEAAFAPAFPVRVVEDRGDTRVEQDTAGRHVLCSNDRHNGFTPDVVRYPVTDRRSWEEKVKWRLNPASPERCNGLEQRLERARRAVARGEMLSQCVNGGFMFLRSLFGPEALPAMFRDQPALIHDCMATWFELADAVIAQHQRHVTLDEIFLAEDICGSQGALIPPDAMREFLFPYYQQLLYHTRARQRDRGRQFFVHVHTTGDCRPVIPLYAHAIRMDVMSPFDAEAGCDVVEMGREHPDLVIRGGLDARVLSQGKRAIDAMLDRILPELRRRGGYLPMCDRCVPENVSLVDYIHFRHHIARLSG